MKNSLHYCLFIFLPLFLSNCKEKKKEVQKEVIVKKLIYPSLHEAKLVAYEDEFWNLINTETSIEIIAKEHDWTEGPLWVPGHEMLLYTDIPRNAVYVWKEGVESEVYLQPSGFMGENFEGGEPGANGLILNSQNQLVLCQHGERRMAVMQTDLSAPKPLYTSIVSEFENKRFNSPNDAVYSTQGDLYFTDPPYGLPKQMEDTMKELDFQGVYLFNSKGELHLLTKEFTRPNGIALSPDEKLLYIANSDPAMAIWKVFEITENGLIGEGKLFYDATEEVASEKGLPDGLKVDNDGNLFATGPGGVFVFSPEGKLLGKIKTGQATSNCAFNSDKSTLYITADSYVLRVKLR
ncbi:SMP-30/gluconolactonase/LRE family protein [Eudoraea chungangensis]|uniref:SMP-30/gluconolactonase/LRE family protein n=1 Tax=Eudoraea chungangensis TaxID=1481905 RepID=UPI0023ED9F79|nr:SMP-30/gluconolactonase/LRE family protein [Eudoraea chungangensis]